ncbi:MAG: zinc ribbon domain-containing protein, partial [Thermoplasmata archaeon]|nr:zinc ribbon domain-containing protein [Thermoplasmata archaeon]
RMCFGCGRYVPVTYPTCPYCGTQAPAQIPYQQAYPYQPAGVPQQVAQPYYGPPPAAPAPVPPGPIEQSCLNCGESLPAGVKFCPKCGTAVQQ